MTSSGPKFENLAIRAVLKFSCEAESDVLRLSGLRLARELHYRANCREMLKARTSF